MKALRRDLLMLALGFLLASILILVEPDVALRQNIRYVGVASLLVIIVLVLWMLLVPMERNSRTGVHSAPTPTQPSAPLIKPKPIPVEDKPPSRPSSPSRRKLDRIDKRDDAIGDGMEELKQRARRKARRGGQR